MQHLALRLGCPWRNTQKPGLRRGQRPKSLPFDSFPVWISLKLSLAVVRWVAASASHAEGEPHPLDRMAFRRGELDSRQRRHFLPRR
jgi:hypothetical protein